MRVNPHTSLAAAAAHSCAAAKQLLFSSGWTHVACPHPVPHCLRISNRSTFSSSSRCAARPSSRPASSSPSAVPATPAPSIAVVGAGVIGLTSALRILQELPGSRVTIFAEKFAADTTTAGAAGVWGPYKLSDTPPELTDRWAGETFQHLTRLFYSPDAERSGVHLVLTHYLLTEEERQQAPPSWHKLVFGFQALDPQHAALLPRQYVAGFAFNNITCEGRYYLQYLTEEIQKRDARIVQTRLQSLGSLFEPGAAGGLQPGPVSGAAGGGRFDAVVDCCGLGARELLGDEKVFPIRGQIMRVRAPWVKQAYFAGDFYIIPNRDAVILGGTGQIGDWNTQTCLEDKARIWAGCCELIPSLAHAEVISDWVGLRPGRTVLRLELEELQVPGQGSGSGGPQTVPVVHNYGHGGAGLTLGWGCAGDVVRKLQQRLGV